MLVHLRNKEADGGSPGHLQQKEAVVGLRVRVKEGEGRTGKGLPNTYIHDSTRNRSNI